MNLTATLTKRETQIAELIAWGLTKKEVATKLFISPRTVENTARSIYEKTGVTKANELSAWYFCSRFKISLDMSPLRRGVVAVGLLLLLIPREIIPNNDEMVRVRTRTVQVRAGRARGRRDGNSYEF